MSFSYFIFKTVFMQIKNHMDRTSKSRKKKEVLPDGVRKLSYHYWKDGDDNHQCNLYTPVDMDPSSLPLIIDIHGGCWVHGDKDIYDNFNYRLVRQGNNVTTLTYRTADIAHLPDQVRDIFNYFHFLKENHKALGISLDHVMLTGDSAGAELSLLVYCINQSPKLQKIFNVEPVDLNIQCLVLTHPVCFIDQAATLPKNPLISKYIAIPGLQRMLYGHKYHEKQEYHHSVNPYRYVSKDIQFPPILLVTSQGDSVFKYQTFLLTEMFDSLDIKYQVYFEEDASAEHVYNINRPFEAIAHKCNEFIIRFFHQLNEASGHLNSSRLTA